MSLTTDEIISQLRANPQYGQRDICEPRLGPYRGIQRIDKRLCFTQEYLILIYSAFDAMGLIGSECNGIAILNHTKRQVVLDKHLKQTSGYQCPTPLQMQEVHRLWTLPDEAFQEFVNNHPRTRSEAKIAGRMGRKTQKAGRG